MKGFKVFNSDFTCRGFKFEEGKEYKHNGPLLICNSGFHFCLKASHCFAYYSFDPNNIVCEVEALGEMQTHEEDSKICTNHIKIIRRLSWDEVLVVANEGKLNTGFGNSGDSNSGDSNSGDSNSGDWNSGDSNSGDSNSGDWNSGDSNSGNRNSGNRNSGYRNSGYRNSGNRNSGDSNSGDSNSGDWNSGNRNSGDSNSGYRNSGAFCTDNNPRLILFNKQTDILVRDWENSRPVQIMRDYLNQNIWIYESEMSVEDKKYHPEYETTGGFLKTISLQEAWVNMWGNLNENLKKEFLNLPGFDSNIFFEITGIKI
jgi:hypothetical protein